VCAISSGTQLLGRVVKEQMVGNPTKLKQVDQTFKLIDTALQVSLGTVDNLLTSSKLLAGIAIQPVVSACDIRRIANAAVLLTCQAYSADSLQCFSSISKDVPERIICDGAWVSQMLLNLLSNAFKFTAEGHVKLTIELTPPSYPANFKCSRRANELETPAILCMVEDTGAGVNPEIQSILFHKTISPSFNGTGIGLYTTGEKTVSLGGACGYFGHAHGGSVFWFSVPINQPWDPAVVLRSYDAKPLSALDIYDAEDQGPEVTNWRTSLQSVAVVSAKSIEEKNLANASYV